MQSHVGIGREDVAELRGVEILTSQTRPRNERTSAGAVSRGLEALRAVNVSQRLSSTLTKKSSPAPHTCCPMLSLNTIRALWLALRADRADCLESQS